MIGMYTAEQVRAAEAARMIEVPAGALMQQAAYGLAQVVLRLLTEATGRVYGSRVVLLVGPGGNGGDALYSGVALLHRGVAVSALLLRDGTYPGALAAFRAAGGTLLGDEAGAPRDASCSALSGAGVRAAADASADAAVGRDAQIAAIVADADVVVDGIAGLGSGRSVGLREPIAAALAAHDFVVAVDVPSGVAVDTGRVADDAVRARATVTFGCHKNGHFLAPAAKLCGDIELIDLGLGPHLPPATAGVLSADEVFGAWPRQPYDGHKYATGVVAIAAGSAKYPGAAVLCVGGALRAKPGMVRYVGEPAAADRVLASWPECVVESSVAATGRAQAWVVGPGLGTDERAAAVLDEVLASDVPVLIDADGLTLLKGRVGELAERDVPTVLTPHAGEFERIFFPIDDPLSAAQRAADESGCVVLLKGPTTVVAAPGAPALVNPTGTARLATAGSGDVLAGIAGSLLAAGIEPRRASAMAAYAHGAAALGAAGMPVASDLPALLRDLLATRLA